MARHGKHREVGIGDDFTAVWIGQTISLFGDYIAYLTIPLFLETLSNRAFDFGMVSAAENIPTLLFGFVGGVLLDRFRLKPILIIGDLLRASAFIVLAIFSTSAGFQVWMLLPFSFLVGSLAASFNAGLQSFIPAVVAPRLLTTANARLSFSQQLAFLLGPLTGGFIVLSLGFPAAFTFNALTFIVSAGSFLFIRAPVDRRLPAAGRLLTELKEGWIYLWKDTRIRLTTLAGSLGNFVTGFIEAALVLIGARILGTDDPAQLGPFVASMGAGGLLGAFTAASVIRIIGIGRAFITGLTLFGMGLFSMTFATDLLALAAILVSAFMGLVWANVSMTTMRQLYTPDRLLGRVTATARALAWGSLPFGALFGTALADRIGLLTIVRVGPVLIVAFALFLISTAVWNAEAVEDHERR
ncbi:MAG: MFS transporter [Acidimicrobiia bacterium]|nr:MFS transporter [Acidimicrobiia bacterium]MDH3398036.1 MFS transporter [Acidimicrobiia bacterium]